MPVKALALVPSDSGNPPTMSICHNSIAAPRSQRFHLRERRSRRCRGDHPGPHQGPIGRRLRRHGRDSPFGQLEHQVTGSLDVDLEPTVVAAAARHVSSVALFLRDDGSVRFRERVQIGRCNEREGFWSGSLRADWHDRPLLRHRVELGAGSLADDSISAPRAAINELRYPTEAFAATAAAPEPGSTVLTLAGGGTLSTWQADRLVG